MRRIPRLYNNESALFKKFRQTESHPALEFMRSYGFGSSEMDMMVYDTARTEGRPLTMDDDPSGADAVGTRVDSSIVLLWSMMVRSKWEFKYLQLSLIPTD